MKITASFLLVTLALGLQAQEPGALRLTQTIPLPGVKGRFDHFAIDAKGHRLFVAALGNDTLEVLDLAAGKRIQSIAGMRKPTGVLFLPELNQVFVANGDDGTLKILNGVDYRLVKNLDSLADADNLRLDPKTKLAYLGYGEGALAIVDPAALKTVADIKLAAHPESFQLERGGNRIFVNVPDAKQIAVIDRDKRTVTGTWPITEFKANFPMALDESNHRLFVGCREPAQLVVFDTAMGKTVTSVGISGDTDDLFYDARLKRIYLSCGQGFIDVIDQRDADTYRLGERIPTRPGARTSFFSADLNEFYLAVPHGGQREAEIRAFRTIE
jgi:DNA-binding beta-propeller fold protein YncE